METRIYRGISREDGRWVIGYLSKTVLDITIIRWRDYSVAVVDESAGQCIGIFDRNDRPIFEGDLIRIGRCSRLFEVRYNPRLARYQACAQGSPVTRELKAVNQKSYEIISNIWEDASNADGAPSTPTSEERPSTSAPSEAR